jgi:hypothetical protein
MRSITSVRLYDSDTKDISTGENLGEMAGHDTFNLTMPTT